MVDHDEALGTSPPLELRRPSSGPRTAITIPHSLQSPQERATDSPQIAQVYVHNTRIPHPHFPDVNPRYYDGGRAPIQPSAEPPPAHRSGVVAVPPQSATYGQPNVPPVNAIPPHMHTKLIERESREQQIQHDQREREKERKASIPRKHLFDLIHLTQCQGTCVIYANKSINPQLIRVCRTMVALCRPCQHPPVVASKWQHRLMPVKCHHRLIHCSCYCRDIPSCGRVCSH